MDILVHVGYVFDEFRDTCSRDLTNWGKLGSHYGLNGNQRTTIQLFGQLDSTKLHSRWKTPSSFPCQPLSHWGSTSLLQPHSPFSFFWAWFIPSGWSMTIHQAWSMSLKGMCSWEGDKGGPSTSWFSYCVRRKPKRFFLPCNWLARTLIIQYVGNL